MSFAGKIFSRQSSTALTESTVPWSSASSCEANYKLFKINEKILDCGFERKARGRLNNGRVLLLLGQLLKPA
jgi:hypothetical protein